MRISKRTSYLLDFNLDYLIAICYIKFVGSFYEKLEKENMINKIGGHSGKVRTRGLSSVKEVIESAKKYLKNLELANTFEVEEKTKSIIGQRIGKLTVISLIGRSRFQTVWVCKCDCGKYNYKFKAQLDKRRALHCGCLTRSLMIKHGHCTDYKPSTDYNLWRGRRDRGVIKDVPFDKWLESEKLTLKKGK